VIDLLFVRPADDSAAIRAAAFGQVFLTMASRFSVLDLNDGQVTRNRIDNALASGVRNLFYFGHGIPTALIAHGQAVVDSTNLRHLSDGVVVAIACYAGQTLAQIAGTSHHNVKAFLGFDDEFGFSFKVPVLTGIALRDGLKCLLLDGHQIGCAAAKLRTAFDVLRNEYRNRGAQHGLSPAESRLGWLFAKSNQYSI
jgi:hypothetical protein